MHSVFDSSGVDGHRSGADNGHDGDAVDSGKPKRKAKRVGQRPRANNGLSCSAPSLRPKKASRVQMANATTDGQRYHASARPQDADGGGQDCAASNGHRNGAPTAAPKAKVKGPTPRADKGHGLIAPHLRHPSGGADIIGQIVRYCRIRRWAMKSQQKLDRSLESFIRVNFTDWEPGGDDSSRKKANARVKAIIAAVRAGDTSDPTASAIAEFVEHNDAARAHFDKSRAVAEKNRLKLCRLLPVAPWVENVCGAGLPGLADIIGLAGDLGAYSSYAKLWKRLGFAPYKGCAGSTWKRETWRPYALTKEEWIANPFSGERYGILYSAADSMFRKNGMGKDKTESGEWEPTHHYGFLYAHRRDHTKITHPEWSDGHRRADALRYMFKKYLRDLWKAWRAATGLMLEEANLPPSPATPTDEREEAMHRLPEQQANVPVPSPALTEQQRRAGEALPQKATRLTPAAAPKKRKRAIDRLPDTATENLPSSAPTIPEAAE